MSELWEEVKEVYEKTLKLAYNATVSPSKVFKSSKRPNTRVLGKIQNACVKFQEMTRKSRINTAKKEQRTSRKKAESVSTKLKQYLPRLSGKVRLNSALTETNRNVSQTRAGKPQALVPEDSKRSPTFLRPGKKLPFISLTSGKVSPSTELPSFKDYVNRGDRPEDVPLSRIEELSKTMEDFTAKIKDLGEEPEDTPVQELPKITNKKQLYDPHAVYTACSNKFKDSRDLQNKKLIDIVEKLEQERPRIVYDKIKFLSQDHDRYGQHSIHMFTNFNRTIDTDRIKRIRKANGQAEIYTTLLNHLKGKNAPPEHAELQFVNSIKDLLEEGWPIEEFSIQQILNKYSLKEKALIKPLVAIISLELELAFDKFVL